MTLYCLEIGEHITNVVRGETLTDITVPELWDIYFALLKHLNDRFGLYEAYEKSFNFMWRFYPDVFSIAVSQSDFATKPKNKKRGD